MKWDLVGEVCLQDSRQIEANSRLLHERRLFQRTARHKL